MTVRCQRPDCAGTGQIDEDGYCDQCGRPPALAPAPAVEPGASTPAPAVAVLQPTPSAEGQPCLRHPEPGVIEDGYCSFCGLAPQAAVPSSAAGVPDGGPVGSVPSASPGRGSASTSPDTNTLRAVPGRGATSGPSQGTGVFREGRGSLGAGLVKVAPVPRRDPLSVVLADPEVPEHRRYCARCDHQVGRPRGDRPGRTEGFCPQCGAPYSFTPKLHPGDLIRDQYQVAGCIAHGGLGWIYLAQNLNLAERRGFRWVVLKGLLDSEDEFGMAAAVAERQFLTEVKHPNIVQIYDFVQHAGAGYIVMEYVGGHSLREIRNQHRAEHGTSLPVAEAIAYMLAILPAFAYLHGHGLLFCDFKPDNAIHTDDLLTLIDLGGVVAMDDEDSALYGTIGYQAPEVAGPGASVASDLYTVARTLAALCLDIPGFHDKKRYATSLPPAGEVPAFARYEAFHQFLLKATATDPGARFQSADEMAEQLMGVLRQVQAVNGEPPQPAPSLLFSAELGNGADASAWQNLPVPAVDPFDPAAGVLATVVATGPEQIRAVLASTPRSPEVALRLARSFIDAGAFDEAEAELDTVEARSSGWRAAWWRGVIQLAAGRPGDARSYFDAVVAELPGELAPRLALAVCCELSAVGDPAWSASVNGGPAYLGSPEDLRLAARYYHIVSATDPGFASASFGLARVLTALGDRAGAVTALQRIPEWSSSRAAAGVALCSLWCADVDGRLPDLADLAAASELLTRLQAEPSVRLALTRDLQLQALNLLVRGAAAADSQMTLAGTPLVEDVLRSSVEGTYRSLARLARTDEERFDLVDLANAYRPRTLT